MILTNGKWPKQMAAAIVNTSPSAATVITKQKFEKINQ
jgi:hypothetical protein